MKMAPDILTRLLKGEHFNVEERKNLGLWPPETLRYSEVLEHLTDILSQQEWFPFRLQTPLTKEAVWEGIVVHQETPNRHVCYSQRSLSNDPGVLAEESRRVFKSARDAAEYYLKWALNLPGRLDGWPVI